MRERALPPMIDVKTIEQASSISRELHRLMDEAPAHAIKGARSIRGRGPAKVRTLVLQAAIFIDAGQAIKDRAALQDGIRILRRLVAKLPGESGLRYNLANGLFALATLQLSSSNYYVDTTEERREARALYHQVANENPGARLQGETLINLGNQLDHGHRWVEAYDCWARALEVDPANGVAALSIARMLQRRSRRFPEHPGFQHSVSNYYARLARRLAAEITQHAGPEAGAMAKALAVSGSSWRPRRRRLADEYARFVSRHRLALVGTIEGVDFRKRRWDTVHARKISEPFNSPMGVPPVFAMLNQLKADFCVARWLAYAATTDQPPTPNTALYMDTLDYAVYGIGPAMLTLAQRAALDVLDRVAVCANEYFRLGEKPTQVTFQDFWREHGGLGPWRTALRPLLNPGIIALAELASDLGNGGALGIKRRLRNAATHRFCILHDEGATGSRPSPGIDHHGYGEFGGETIATLQVARSAILYLLDAIAWAESHRPRGAPALQLEVVPHHHIRGEVPRPRVRAR